MRRSLSVSVRSRERHAARRCLDILLNKARRGRAKPGMDTK